MKEFINKIVNNQQVDINELNTFIVDYCKLMENKIPDATELVAITQLIQSGMFNLIYAVKNACIKLGVQLNILYDKNGQMIKLLIA
jgi:hypothetical protein